MRKGDSSLTRFNVEHRNIHNYTSIRPAKQYFSEKNVKFSELHVDSDSKSVASQ